MGVKFLALICAGIGSCSLFDVKLPSANVKGSYTVNSLPTGGCGESNAAFKDVDLAGGDLLKAADGVDASIACLKSAKFTLSSTLDTLQTSAVEGTTCSGPAGTVTLDSYDLSYEYKENGTTKSEHVTFDCPDKSLDYSASVTDIQHKINACMDVINSTGQDKLRVAINRHADKIKIAGVGSCSNDACFSAKFSFQLKLEDGVISVGGDCK